MKMQLLFVLVALVLSVTQCAAVSLKVDEAAFPPVVFTYNATACASCKHSCRSKFDRIHLTQRKECATKCDKEEFCVHYSPVEVKPDPVRLYTVNRALSRAALQAVRDNVIQPNDVIAAGNNITQALLNVIKKPKVQYVGAEERPVDAAEFFAKLQDYIKWKQTKCDTQKNYTAPELKVEETLPAIPVVCVECLHKVIGQNETILAHVTDRPENVTVPTKPVKPTEPVKPVEPVKPDPEVPVEGNSPDEGVDVPPLPPKKK